MNQSEADAAFTVVKENVIVAPLPQQITGKLGSVWVI